MFQKINFLGVVLLPVEFFQATIFRPALHNPLSTNQFFESLPLENIKSTIFFHSPASPPAPNFVARNDMIFDFLTFFQIY